MNNSIQSSIYPRGCFFIISTISEFIKLNEKKPDLRSKNMYKILCHLTEEMDKGSSANILVRAGQPILAWADQGVLSVMG